MREREGGENWKMEISANECFTKKATNYSAESIGHGKTRRRECRPADVMRDYEMIPGTVQ